MADPKTPDPAPEAKAEPEPKVDPTQHPVGVPIVHRDHVKAAVEDDDMPASTWIGDHEYAVDSKTGRVTGKA